MQVTGFYPQVGQIPWRREWLPAPLRILALRSSMDRGAWRATVCGVTKSQTQLSDFHSLICISLFRNEAENPFLILLILYISFLSKLFISFASFLNVFSCCMSSKGGRGIGPLYDLCVADIYLVCYFLYFVSETLFNFNFMQSSLSLLVFVNIDLVSEILCTTVEFQARPAQIYLKLLMKIYHMVCYSVTKSCPTFCDPVDYSTPGCSVYCCLLELAPTHLDQNSSRFFSQKQKT